MRGYDRHAVDEFVAELLGLVQDLESRQTREGVVQKALGELGEETAGILQRAHETADDISARSRAQADARLQRAEREAEILRRDADEYAEQVVVDTRLLWEERQRLIEDIRQLADEVLGTADDAMERLKLPEQLGSAEDGPTTPRTRSRGRSGWRAPRTTAVDPRRATRRGRARLRGRRASRRRRSGSAGRGGPAARSPRRDESGHTVELEALPGGEPGDEGDDDERERRPSGASALQGHLAATLAAGLGAAVGCLARRAEALGEEAPDDARRLASRLLAHSQRAVDPALGPARDAGPGRRGSAG